jgi:LDH2 family malate/lactate/ureidoglycolate dehydrogenase
MAIDISAFVELDRFKKTTGDILRELRASVKMPGQERIYTAGEKEYLAWLSRKDTGVPLNESLRNILKALKEEYQLDNYKFSF